MKYCTKCTMPDTRPGIVFDENGVCSACRHYENRKNVDWDARWKEFEELCDKYRDNESSASMMTDVSLLIDSLIVLDNDKVNTFLLSSKYFSQFVTE